MKREIRLFEDKEYQEVNGYLDISIPVIQKAHSIYPFSARDLDIALLWYGQQKPQSEIGELLGVGQSLVSYIVKKKVPRHIARVLELEEIVPEFLALDKRIMTRKQLKAIVLILYMATAKKAAKGVGVERSTVLKYLRAFEKRIKNQAIKNYINRWILTVGRKSDV